MKFKFKQHGTPDTNGGEIDLGIADVRIEECYNGVAFETSGYIYGVAMRDSGLEIQVWPADTTDFSSNENKTQSISVQPTHVEVMRGRVHAHWEDHLPETSFVRPGSSADDPLLQNAAEPSMPSLVGCTGRSDLLCSGEVNCDPCAAVRDQLK